MKNPELINEVSSILYEVANLDTDDITHSDLTAMLDWRTEVIIKTLTDTHRIEQLRNAYYRMDDALDGLAAAMNEQDLHLYPKLQAAYRAHKLTERMLRDVDLSWYQIARPGDDPSPANNND